MARLMQFLYATKTVWAVLPRCSSGSMLILAAGANPIEAYRSLFGEAFFDYYRLRRDAGEILADPARRPRCRHSAAGRPVQCRRRRPDLYRRAVLRHRRALSPERYWPLHL